MKILITGVAGFIGSNLAAKLLEKNYNIVGIDNFSYGFERNIRELLKNKSFQFIQGDIANPLILKDIKADLIIHLASQKIPRYSSALRTLEENYLMLRNIVHKCLIDKSKLIFASTSDVYGKNKELPFHEESDLVMGPTTVKRWSYALSKIYGEQYIIANHDEFNLTYTIVRFFGSYGPHQNITWWGGPQSVFITQAFNNESIDIHGDGTQTRTFTFVEDTIKGIICCIENELSNNEIFNISSSSKSEIKIVDLAKLIWQLINPDTQPKLNFVPYSAFGKYEDVVRRVGDISKIQKFFDYIPQWSLKEGLIKTIDWQKRIMNL